MYFITFDYFLGRMELHSLPWEIENHVDQPECNQGSYSVQGQGEMYPNLGRSGKVWKVFPEKLKGQGKSEKDFGSYSVIRCQKPYFFKHINVGYPKCFSSFCLKFVFCVMSNTRKSLVCHGILLQMCRNWKQEELPSPPPHLFKKVVYRNDL